MLRAGVDIGGTDIKIGLIDDLDMKFKAKTIIPFTYDGYETVVAKTAEKIKELLKEAGGELSSIGLAVPGSIDIEKGVVIHAHNLNYHSTPIVSEMKKHFPDLPVLIGNDADCAALGEFCCGAFRGYDTAVILTLGTGVGGGIICKGKLFSGGRKNGVELGHMMLKYGGIKCSCGNLGCVESYCTATWIINEGRKVIEAGRDSLIVKRSEGDLEKVDAKLVIDCAKEGDFEAKAIFDIFVDNLSAAITSINACLDPEIMALGGGVSKAGDFLFTPLREKVREKSFFKIDYNIVQAQLGNDAGIVGACMLFRNGE
ncbi:MAG: ROK family protein [Anaerovoracaceae bacterium]